MEKNQENQQTKIQRKIRVTISDPDATESSSDEEQETKRPSKRTVYEIVQDHQVIKSTPFSRKLYPGVRKRKSGKFCAEIRSPFSKKRMWLGTFNTAEEAYEVYKAKKLEFEVAKMSKEKEKVAILKICEGDVQNSDSSNGIEEKSNVSSEEQQESDDMWMGEWVQISEDKEVKFCLKLGVPIVDNYGFLLGEFSTLDDLSIY